MPSFAVSAPLRSYEAVVERGILARTAEYIPPGAGKLFVVTVGDVWRRHGEALAQGLRGRAFETLFLPGGEETKRLAPLEDLALDMVAKGADRTSVIVAFGGGIVTDMAGFLAAMFMRGIEVVQIPTTLLAQVDAAIGGKTGVNLTSGKNLIGAFHQPLAVLIDPLVLATLPEREYRAGLFEVVKYGVISSPSLFWLLSRRRAGVLARDPELVDEIVAESVRIKCEVVSADEREHGLRKILNFGHTIGHALEAETSYTRFLHGEAVAFGMRAATHLGAATGHLAEDREAMLDCIAAYGPIPPLAGIAPERLLARLVRDKKTIQSRVHFVLPRRVGEVEVVSGVPDAAILQAIEAALA
jgi:3-dehydroquinate synthase